MPQPDPTYAPADLTPATWGRRILALVVDWVTCLAVVEGLVAVGLLAGNPNGLGTLGLFVLESAFFTALAGGSFGKLVARVRVVRQDDPSRPVSLLRAVLRSALVALLVPPLLTFDGRGLHDLAAGTRTVRV
ncbi:RDD family protein [Nocardioides sp.]|uniref:RDD family protein n=1 Tax=Nocardioides sp. TaxID=35761 RepID=UPI0035B39EB3